MTERSDCGDIEDGNCLAGRAPVAVYVLDIESGRIQSVNDRAVEVLGYAAVELVGEQYTALHPDAPTDAEALYGGDNDRGQRDVLREYPDGSTLTVETASDRELPVEIHCRYLDTNGNVLVCVLRGRANRADDQWQTKLLQAATDDLLEARSTTEVADLVAETARDLFGYATNVVRLVEDGVLRPAAVVGRTETKLGARPVYSVDGTNPAARAFRHNEPVQYADVSTVEDGYDRGAAGGALYVPIGDYGVISILDPDVGALDRGDKNLVSSLATSARRMLERLAHERDLERKNEQLDEFASILSHDLQNPLSVAQSNLSLVSDGTDDAHLDTVGAALDRMEDIVRDSLTLSRQDTKTQNRETIPVWELARSTWEMVETGDARLDVVDDFTLRGDRGQLAHLFENLFDNSVAHAVSEAPSDTDTPLTVTVGRLESAAGFYVADDGCGFDREPDEQLFEAGYTTANDGTGLGLAIVRRAAEAHGWSVQLGAGEGARFEFVGVDGLAPAEE